jgi:N-acetylglucosamine malate deacetylase 2
VTRATATAWPPVSADAAPGDQRFSGRPLPRAGHVLAVTARPGPESADLGALLYAFRRRGASLALLTLTRGEASAVNSTCERLEDIRPWELQVAAGLLGITSLTLADYPDGALHRYPPAELTERVRRAIRTHAADLLLVVDPAGGSAHRDPASGSAWRDPADAAVARAVCAAAEQTGVPVLARMPRPARYGWHVDLGPAVATARLVQRAAVAAHASQAAAAPRPGPSDHSGHREQLRWLIPPPRG